MATWKLIALDMDGTLLDENQQVSAENQRWIARARMSGIEVTLATGRLRRALVQDVVASLGLQVPLVTVNGGEVWSAAGELLEQHAFASDDVAFLLALAERYDIGFWASPTVGEPVHPDTLPSAYRDMQWLKFGFYTQSAGLTRELRLLLEGMQRFEVSNSAPLNLEVNPRGVTKATGLARVCTELGIEPHDVIAMGDSLNDIPMFRFVGRAIAMGNAQPEVKAAAAEITADHRQHGVARAIERLLVG